MPTADRYRFCYRFHPAIQRLKAILDSKELGNIKSVQSSFMLPVGFIGNDDIRFSFDLGGGAMMDAGGEVYCLLIGASG